MKKILLILLVSVFSTHLFAQNSGRKIYPGATRTRSLGKAPIYKKIAYPWTYSIGIGRTSYMGTLCPDGDCLFGFHALDFQANFGLKYRFTSRLSVGATFRYLNLSASDAESGSKGTGTRTNRNLSFHTIAFEFMPYVQFDIIPIISSFLGEKSDQYNRRNFIVPYGLGGVGLLYFNPRGIAGDDALSYGLEPGKAYSLRSLITSEDKENGSFYSPIVPVFMLGIGTQIKITEYFDIGADIQLQKPLTQYLDDVGGISKYPSWNGLSRSEAAQKGVSAESWYFSDRTLDPVTGGYSRIDTQDANLVNDYRGGNPEVLDRKDVSRDTYFLFNIKLTYTVSNPLKLWNPAHKHFRGGKGGKHHHFDKR